MTDLRLERLGRLIAASPHNLVSRSQRAAISDHVEECAALAAMLPLADGQRWMDLGTGGGLPGLVLAVLAPNVSWTLVDATRKKAGAAESFARELNLDNVRVVTGRAEDLARDPAFRGHFDGVVSRALARLDAVAELCRGFLRSGGVIAAVKGPRWREEARAAETWLPLLGLSDIHSAVVADSPRPSCVVTMRARGAVPDHVPRSNGIPQARPLGGSNP